MIRGKMTFTKLTVYLTAAMYFEPNMRFGSLCHIHQYITVDTSEQTFANTLSYMVFETLITETEPVTFTTHNRTDLYSFAITTCPDVANFASTRALVHVLIIVLDITLYAEVTGTEKPRERFQNMEMFFLCKIEKYDLFLFQHRVLVHKIKLNSA